MSEESGLGERAISQVVEAGLSSQLEAADELAVDIKADLLQAVQGQIGQVSIAGKGLVVQNSLRVEELDFKAEHISVNPLSALFGQLKLDQPLDSSLRLVLSEDDINQALNQPGVIEALPALEMTSATVSFKLRSPITIRFPDDNTINIEGHATLYDDQAYPIDFDAIAYLYMGNHLSVERFGCQPGQGVSIDFAIALMQWINRFIKQPSLNWQTVELQISELTIQKGQLSLQANARMN
jgi:hypothetical protein